ncbi:MAG: hypothetical protein WBA13_04050 [Microcoleaceae cyanobacterium]
MTLFFNNSSSDMEENDTVDSNSQRDILFSNSNVDPLLGSKDIDSSSSEIPSYIKFEVDGDDLVMSIPSGDGFRLIGQAPEMDDPLGFFNDIMYDGSEPSAAPSTASDSLTNPQPYLPAQWEFIEPFLLQDKETAADLIEQIEAETIPELRETLQNFLSETEERIAYTESRRPLPVEETDSLLVEEVPIIQEAYFFAEGSVISPEFQQESAGSEVFFVSESYFTQPDPEVLF